VSERRPKRNEPVQNEMDREFRRRNAFGMTTRLGETTKAEKAHLEYHGYDEPSVLAVERARAANRKRGR
jgi:hypothetical protein